MAVKKVAWLQSALQCETQIQVSNVDPAAQAVYLFYGVNVYL